MPFRSGRCRDFLAAVVDEALDGIIVIDETGSKIENSIYGRRSFISPCGFGRARWQL